MLSKIDQSRVRLFLILLAILAGFAVIILVTGTAFQYRYLRRLAAERNSRLAHSVALAIVEDLDSLAQKMVTLAELAEVDPDVEHVISDATSLLREFELGIAFLDSHGTALATSGPTAFWSHPAVQERLLAFAVGEPRLIRGFSEIFTDPFSGEYRFLVFGRGKEGLIAVGAIQPHYLAQKNLESYVRPGDEVSLTLMGNGDELLHSAGSPHLHQEMSGLHPGILEARQGQTGTAFIFPDNQMTVPHLVAFNPIMPVRWTLIVEESWEAVAAPWLVAGGYLPLVMIAPLILALLALWFIYSQVLSPLEQLQHQAVVYFWGDSDAFRSPLAAGIPIVRHLHRELEQMAKKVWAKEKGLRSYVGAITRGQEEERRRLSRELHDDSAQSLVVVNQRLQNLQFKATEELVPELMDLEQQVTETIEGIRRLSHNLRPLYLEELGLLPALEKLTSDRKDFGVTVDFSVSGRPQRLSDEIELALYRISQEALTNAYQHASANRIELTIAFSNDRVTLTIADNGCGFKLPENQMDLNMAGHFGLSGMRERAQLVGGLLTIKANPGKGMTITTSIPTVG